MRPRDFWLDQVLFAGPMTPRAAMINIMFLTRWALALVLLGGSVAACEASGDESCSGGLALCAADGAASADATTDGADAGFGADGSFGQSDAAAEGPPRSVDSGVDSGASSVGGDAAPAYTHQDLTVTEVWQWIEDEKPMALLDVREPSEYDAGHLPGAINMALGSGVLAAQLDRLPRDKPIVVYCASGNRSNQAANFLTEKGFRPVYDMLGGIGAWRRADLPPQ